jgi:tRNA G18 (ribose-2'-O)-methylase SpoU
MANARALAKTALGAEKTVKHHHYAEIGDALASLRSAGYVICAIEQAPRSTNLFEYQAYGPTALILGNEVEGISAEVLSSCDQIIELPMLGSKESLNVATTAGIAVYQLKFGTR